MLLQASKSDGRQSRHSRFLLPSNHARPVGALTTAVVITSPWRNVPARVVLSGARAARSEGSRTEQPTLAKCAAGQRRMSFDHAAGSAACGGPGRDGTLCMHPIVACNPHAQDLERTYWVKQPLCDLSDGERLELPKRPTENAALL